MSFGPPATPPVVKNLLIANAVVLVLYAIPAFQGVLEAAALRPIFFWQEGYVWQPFTYMWLHAGLLHFALNMFMLWMFGSQIALVWGPRRFLRYYLICGIGAGFFIASYPYLLVALGIAPPRSLVIPTIGASGAVYGIVLAYSLTWPDRTIMLIFPPVAFRAIWLIPAMFFMTLLFGGTNISHIGHLGGVVVGWLLLRRQGQAGRLFSLQQLRARWRRYRMRQKLRAVRHEEWEAKRRRDDHRYH